MSDNSRIEWTEATWNCVTGCSKISAGCDHCYAETFAERWRGVPGHHFENGFDVTLRPERLDQPLRWKRPRRIFVNSMSDLFHEAVPDSYIAEVFGVMAQTPQHTYQLLTKRHGRMRSLLLNQPSFQRRFCFRWPLPNLWIGISAEDQKWADIRIPALLDTPAAVRFVSAEPLLGPITLKLDWLAQRCCPICGEFADVEGSCGPLHDAMLENPGGIGWVIAGGESGPGARPMRAEWARSLQDQCAAAGVPFFFKQDSGPRPGRQGRIPDDLWTVKEFPAAAEAVTA